MYEIVYTGKAKKQRKKIDKKHHTYKVKLDQVISTLKNSPFKKSECFEELKYSWSGYYSRCPEGQKSKDRVVYKVDKENKIVYLFSIMGHAPRTGP